MADPPESRSAGYSSSGRARNSLERALPCPRPKTTAPTHVSTATTLRAGRRAGGRLRIGRHFFPFSPQSSDGRSIMTAADLRRQLDALFLVDSVASCLFGVSFLLIPHGALESVLGGTRPGNARRVVSPVTFSGSTSCKICQDSPDRPSRRMRRIQPRRP